MGFQTLIQRIVYKISGRSTSSSGLYMLQDDMYDYAIGGVPFLSATNDTRPDREQAIEQRKQQFDNYKDPGEYSLNQWWLRSQTSFVGGAGVIYQDPDTQGQPLNIRYNHSVGVDPFTNQDIIQLLHAMNPVNNLNADTNNGIPKCQGSIMQLSGDPSPQDRMWLAKGASVNLTTVATNSLTSFGTATLTTSGAASGIISDIVEIVDSTTSPTTYFLYVLIQDTTTTANAGIWKVQAASGAMTATHVYTANASQFNQTLGKAHGQLAYAQSNRFWMLDPYAGASTALPATPNATLPKDQVITSITDGPDGVYVAANSSTQGFIYKSTFDNNGVVNGLTLTAVLPAGERVNYINGYINTYMVISTTTGIRIGTFNFTGIQYGPDLITVPTVGTSAGPDGSSGFGRSVFFGSNAYVCTLGTPQHDSDFGLMAINLGNTLSDNTTNTVFNPYCTWTYFPGTATSIYDVAVTATGRTVFTVGTGSNMKIYVESSNNLLSTGYLDTGRCRFNTIEPKLFKYISLKTPTPLLGSVSVALLSEGGGLTNYVTYGPTFTPGVDDISTPIPIGPQNWIALRFTLKPGSDPAFGGQLDSWQIKALPGTIKQRSIVRQLLCFNQEKDKSGQIISGDTSALDRLTAIRQMCQRGDTVTYQDLVNDISTQVVIDNYQFTMLSPPGPNSENYGGYLTVQMRTVADAVPPVSPAGGTDPDS